MKMKCVEKSVDSFTRAFSRAVVARRVATRARRLVVDARPTTAASFTPESRVTAERPSELVRDAARAPSTLRPSSSHKPTSCPQTTDGLGLRVSKFSKIVCLLSASVPYLKLPPKSYFGKIVKARRRALRASVSKTETRAHALSSRSAVIRSIHTSVRAARLRRGALRRLFVFYER